MTENVSTFLPVKINESQYLLFLLHLNDYTLSINQALFENARTLGRDLEVQGRVIIPYENKLLDIRSQIKNKEWPDGILERLQTEFYPCMLIIENSFREFNPLEHRWSIIWFSNFAEGPDDIARVFWRIASKIQEGKDLFGFLQSLQGRRGVEIFRRYFNLRPGVFGISVNINAILEDLNEI